MTKKCISDIQRLKHSFGTDLRIKKYVYSIYIIYLSLCVYCIYIYVPIA